MKALHQKLELVFRYPTHQNKLIQYINSKSARIALGKMKQDHLHHVVHNFLVQYVKKGSDCLILNRSAQKVVNDDIQKMLETFISANPNSYEFPQKFL
jgi:DNA polymerase-3 subunit alpha (Gram-positive type)